MATIPSYFEGLLTPQDLAGLRSQALTSGLLSAGQALARSGAPSLTPGGGTGIADAAAQFYSGYQGTIDSALQNMIKAQQVQEIIRKQKDAQRVQEILAGAMTPQYQNVPATQTAIPSEVGPAVVETPATQQLVGYEYDLQKVAPTLLAMGRPDIVKNIAEAQKLMEGKGELTGEYANIALGLFGTADVKKLPKDAFGQISQEIVRQNIAKSPKTVLDMTGGQKGFENEMKLKSEFKSEPVYKAFTEMQSAYGQITDSLKQASPAGDLAAATKFMKLLDPGSVVRESELGMAMAASGALDRARNYAQLRISGEKLTPDQRKDFQTLSDQLFSTAASAYNRKRSEYAEQGSQYGLNAERALGKPATMPKRNITVDY